jgi:hypothetical protein
MIPQQVQEESFMKVYNTAATDSQLKDYQIVHNYVALDQY